MTWCLVGNTGAVHILPQSMIFVGRDNCEINITSRSVDKRHSVINFDRSDDAFCIKDMETLNGTFVNDTRIPDSTYISLQRGDSIRFGYDPVTYRFDEVDPSSVRQFKAEDGINKLEIMDGTGNSIEKETKDGGDENEYDEEMKEGYSTKPSRQHNSQYEPRTTAVENRMMSHGRTTPLKQEFSVSSQPSSLYGQPAWWGQDDVVKGEGPVNEMEEGGRKSRTGNHTANGKDAHASPSHPSHKHLERPTRLPLNEAERDRDIPIHMYTRQATGLHPTTPVKRPSTPEHTEVTLVSASEKHVGFTIEFNAKEDAPKLSMNESLSEFVPAGVRSKFEGSSKMVEDMKAERMKKSVTDDQDSYQSPRMSPSAVQKLNTMWSSGKKGSKAGPGDSRTANNSETSKGDAAKQLKMRPLVSPRQPVSSKSGPVKSQSSHGPHKNDDHHNDQNGDNVSESGTYTIESESQSKEVLEARSKIDEVFGVGASMDAKQGSDEDTDKDIEDEEIQEEAVTMERVQTQEMDVGKYLDREYGKPSEQGTAKPPFQPKPPATGSSNAPAWVRQWAVLAGKDTSPREPGRSPRSDTSQSPRNYSQDAGAAEDMPSRSPHQAGQGPTAPPRRGGKRLLPTTPPERGDRLSPHLTSSEDSSRPNGLHVRQSPSSAFYSPRNREGVASSQQEEPTAYETNVSWRELSTEPKPAVFVSKPVAEVGSSSAVPVRDEEDFHTEVSMDTEILLKDTETFVKSLEMRMRDRQRSTPSPDFSESYDLSHRSFDGDIDTDLDTASCVSLVGTSGAYPLTTNQASLPPSGYQAKRSVHDRKTESKAKTPDEKNKKGGIWNRLSQPSRYKRNEKTPPAQSKDSSVTSDGMSDSMDSASFRRNTNITGSLPTGRITGRKTPRESESKDKTPKIVGKIKANLSKPRQTRSTMLRKSRFDGKDSPGPEHSDISPSSSISDMSSSRNSSMLRRSVPSQKESLARCQSPKDLHSRTKTASARIDTGRQRISSRSSEQTPRSEVSLGAQIVQQARSQSLRERKINSGETSARIMGKVQNSSTRTTTTTTSSRKSSLSSTDSAAVKKAPTGTWRRYKEPPTETDAVDAYIRTVTSRKSSLSSADESSIKSAPAYNYYKPRSNSNPSHQQQQQQQQHRTAMSMQHLAGAHYQQQWSRQEGLQNGTAAGDIAQASNSLAENLQRLSKGESTLGMAMEHIPKDERMMDEILSEDTVGVGERVTQRDEMENNHRQPLQRSTSLGYDNTGGLFSQSPPSAQPGSPPVAMKHKQWTKPESFDMLVMSSINHLSVKLKDSTDKLAYKLKKLQSPNATDAELREVLKDAESPLLKTHNKEIANILKNMRQLEKRLTEIHTMIDPRDAIELPEQLTPAAQIRRKYISDYGASSTSSSSVTIQGPAGVQSKAQQWGKSGQQGPSPGKGASPAQTPKSSRSDESEYYL
ncbi:centrosomal protein of 170 kDa protein B-like isoform X2 [Patiria miniata]|uniref:FHA domain-containing protein n=1 Tax=Patiria miniata TaxID=46514 RepID=A0A914BDW9_PATMI|nr:centrosomal protein of 170 kDa protein B-like isoform X2 [Patiria miniata]